jgi:hypothetical protein
LSASSGAPVIIKIRTTSVYTQGTAFEYDFLLSGHFYLAGHICIFPIKFLLTIIPFKVFLKLEAAVLKLEVLHYHIFRLETFTAHVEELFSNERW